MLKTSYKTIAIIFFISIVSTASSAPIDEMPTSSIDVVNISAEEAWTLLSDTANGIQIPIDVRTDEEWQADRIDTPYPEYPRHVSVTDLQNSQIREEFMVEYAGFDLIIYCKSGGRSSSAASLLSNSGFNGTVYNMLGGITAWKGGDFPSKSGNSPPLIPNTPSGEAICTLHESYTFSSSTTDPNDDLIKYGWDWDMDDIIDDWTDFYSSGEPMTITHSFQTPGSTQIQVKCEDLVGVQSEFSDPFSILINQAPLSPTITGPTEGKTGEQYSYIISLEDPDNHALFYLIEWGDGTTDTNGPYASDSSITLNHTWSEQDLFSIQVKAIDEYGAESAWATLEMTIPKQKTLWSVQIRFHQFLENIVRCFY